MVWWKATWRLASVDHVNCEHEYDYKGHNPDQQLLHSTIVNDTLPITFYYILLITANCD